MTIPGDPADPRTWYQARLHALQALQRGDEAPARAYLRFVAQHRGRAVAEAAGARLRAAARDAAQHETAATVNRKDVTSRGDNKPLASR